MNTSCFLMEITNMEPKPTNRLKNYARFSGAAIQMGVIITASALFGSWLDDKYNPKGYLFTLILTLFGVFAAMYIIIKEVIKMSKEDENK